MNTEARKLYVYVYSHTYARGLSKFGCELAHVKAAKAAQSAVRAMDETVGAR